MEQETRFSAGGLEIRSEAGQRPKLVGYAAVFNSRSLPLGPPGNQFVEIIRPAAFRRSLQADHDILAVVGHQPEAILGRRSKGTLTIGEDDRGLRFELSLPDTTRSRDLIEDVRAGNLEGMSFGFSTPKGGDRWDFGALPPLRELVDVDLVEISVTTMPAYPRTEVALRSLASAQEESERVARELDARARRLAEITADMKR